MKGLSWLEALESPCQSADRADPEGPQGLDLKGLPVCGDRLLLSP